MNNLIFFSAVILPWLLIGALGVWLALAKDKIKTGRQILSALGLAIVTWFIASLFKYNFPSPRPFEVVPDFEPLFITGHGDAFPSGHAAFFGALALALFWQNRLVGLGFLIGAILVSVARILAGVHWPGDVLAGFGTAILVVSLIFLIKKKLISGHFGL